MAQRGPTECSGLRCQCAEGTCSDTHGHCVDSQCLLRWGDPANKNAVIQKFQSIFGVDISIYDNMHLGCLSCSFVVPDYNKVVMRRMAFMMNAVYDEPRQEMYKHIDADRYWKVAHFFNVHQTDCLLPITCHDTQVLIATTRSNNDALCVSFRGTKERNDAFTDMQGLGFKAEYDGSLTWQDDNCGIYPGFRRAYSIVRNQVQQVVTALGPNYTKIYITGHSLGGALAQVCASHISTMIPDLRAKLRVVSFGAPRVGNDRFAMMYKLNIPHSFRVVDDKDPVPKLPPSKMGWEHTHNSLIYYSGQWRYNWSGSVIVDPRTHSSGDTSMNPSCPTDRTYACLTQRMPNELRGFSFKLPDSFACLQKL
eukprot:NODE_1023_length_1315_cov_238.807267_g842_i0.p1 GENE.NODE_1023_length_1315_cov_238.807267_g842_i0~~NODE_1023_length_1315_cov_238.807267_g842_i0.p1  ORF type:complete len:396 (+),score=105.12 NODE_1023_length_1315_cov_238.807267_g842_i0:92-1189(+)